MSPSTTTTEPKPETPTDWEPNPEDFEQEEAPVLASTSAGVKGPKVEDALGHWSKHIENFETSSVEYYTKLKDTLAARRIPGFRVRRVNFSEGSVLDAKREYLRVERDDIRMDICAAPFGTGFFFSWWLAGRPRSRWYLVVAGLCVVGFLFSRTRPYRALANDMLRSALFGGGGIGATIVFALPFLLLILAALILLVPLLRRFFGRLTYYKVDTMLMFKSAVHGTITETIDGLTTAKGLRALTEDEKKPIMRDFFKG